MEIEQQLRWALMSGEPGKDAEDAVMARVSAAAWRASQSAHRRRPRPLIVTGLVLVVAAAAAMLALRPREQPPTEALATMRKPEPLQQSVHEAVKVSPVIEAPPRSNAMQPVVAAEPPTRTFTVRVTLQDKTTDEEAKAGLQLLLANVLQRLRDVPGLTMIEPAPTSGVADAPVDFELTVEGGRRPSPREFSAALMADTRKPDGALLTRAGIVTTVIPGKVAPACVRPEVAPLSCRDPASVAAHMVDSMRKTVFPPDPSLRQALQADLLDQRLDPKQRLRALGTIATLNPGSSAPSRAGRTSTNAQFNPTVIRAAIDLAATATDASVRAQVWRTLRGSGSRELVEPLIVAAHEESDGEARLEAVATLATDFSSDERVRAALETVVGNESLPLVRAVAQRGLAGDAVWNAYMIDSLKDESRSDAERIEALVYGMFDRGRPEALGNHWDQVSSLLDDKAIGALAQVLPGLQLSAKMTPGMFGQLMANVFSIRHPAITELLVRSLAGKAGVMDRTMAANALLDRGEDPSAAAALAASDDSRVRAVLEQASTSDPDPERREMAASILKIAAAKVSVP